MLLVNLNGSNLTFLVSFSVSLSFSVSFILCFISLFSILSTPLCVVLFISRLSDWDNVGHHLNS